MKRYDITTNSNYRNENDQMDMGTDRDNADGNNFDPKDEDARPLAIGAARVL